VGKYEGSAPSKCTSSSSVMILIWWAFAKSIPNRGVVNNLFRIGVVISYLAFGSY